ncbi:MAG: lysylphosphatidylglycerol synthase domain-containing protein [Magnetospirillum sp.]|nr:lysylphosphatidylglycerol synthase domain-containing protein [Magnetospirillum sp.]
MSILGKAWEWLRRLKAGRLIAPAVSVAVFAGALLILHRTLGRFDPAQVLATARSYPAATLIAALGLSAASYATLCGFDWLALHHLRRSLPVGWTSLISFVSHAVSHNAGFAMLTGGSVRLRMYSSFGLSLPEVAGVVAFAGLAFGLGVSALGAGAFIAEGDKMARLLHLPPPLLTGLGWLVAALLLCYLGWTGLARRPLSVGGWRVEVPSLGVSLGQMAVAATDLALVSAALYLLLPDGGGMSYPAFVGIYVVATVAGIISHVPGGLGVFEGALAILLPDMGTGPLLAALLVFRGFYNLAPLLLAALVLAVFELIQRYRHASGPAWVTALGPALGAVLVFGAGTVLLLSGAVERAAALPQWLAEPAGMAAGAVGGVLLAAAWGVSRQNAESARLALGALALGAALALARGPDWVTAALLAAAAAVIAAAGPLFPRPAPPADGGIPWGWTGAAAAVVVLSVWLTLHGGREGWRAAARLFSFAAGDTAAPALRAELAAAVALATAAWAGARGRTNRNGGQDGEIRGRYT